MNILGIDTSTKRLCLGLMNGKGRIIEHNPALQKRHADSLMPQIEKALGRIRFSLSEVDYFVVGLGPGSFTGLRIGLATIKGFALAFNKAVIGVPTLDLIAANALDGKAKFICPLIDAKRNMVFASVFRSGIDNKLKRKSPYLLLSVNDLLKRLGSESPVVFLGDGAFLYRQLLRQKIKRSILLSEEYWYPKGKNLIMLASGIIEKNKHLSNSRIKHRVNSSKGAGYYDAEEIKPIYLYPKECQVANSKWHMAYGK